MTDTTDAGIDGRPGTLYVRLQNGWGNVLIELMTAHALAQALRSEECEFEVIGLTSPQVLETHTALHTEAHAAEGLVDPRDLASIFPQLRFLPTEPPDCDLVYGLHGEPNLELLRSHRRILLLLDWILEDLSLLLPALQKDASWLALFRPAPEVETYLRRHYLPAGSEGCAALHVRIRQPGDVMGRVRLPTPTWYRDAVEQLGGAALRRLFVVSGISTAHWLGINYLGDVVDGIRAAFPGLPVQVVQGEPCYVDFFLLGTAPSLILSNSTFSLASALMGSVWGLTNRVLMPSVLLEDFHLATSGFERFQGDGSWLVALHQGERPDGVPNWTPDPI